MALMTRLRILAVSILLMCHSDPVRPEGGLAVDVFRAFPVFASEGSRRIARGELGCDPCEEIIHPNLSGTKAHYFINPAAGLRLSSTEIQGVRIESDERGSLVLLALNEAGRDAVESFAVAQDDYAANFVDGNLVGVVPLRIFRSHFVLAAASSSAAAKEIMDSVNAELR